MSKLIGSLMKQAQPKLKVFLKYALVELTPPLPTDIPAITRSVANIIAAPAKGTMQNLTVKEAWVNTLICVEVGMWFFIGECIGKRHIVGYDV